MVLLVVFYDGEPLGPTAGGGGSGVVGTRRVHRANTRIEAVQVQVLCRVFENHCVLCLDRLRLVSAWRHDNKELVTAVGNDGVVVVSAVVALTLPQYASSFVALNPVVLTVGGLEDNRVPVLDVHVLACDCELYVVALRGDTTAVVRVTAGAKAADDGGGVALYGFCAHAVDLQGDDCACEGEGEGVGVVQVNVHSSEMGVPP